MVLDRIGYGFVTRTRQRSENLTLNGMKRLRRQRSAQDRLSRFGQLISPYGELSG